MGEDEVFERLAALLVYGGVESAYSLVQRQLAGAHTDSDPVWTEIRAVWTTLDSRSQLAVDSLVRQALADSVYCLASVFGQSKAPYSDDATGEVYSVGIEVMRFSDRDAWAADQRLDSFRLFFDESTYTDDLALQCINAFEEWESRLGAEEAQVDPQEVTD